MEARHIDNDPHVRSIVKLSLGRDPTLAVMSAATGDETLAKAAAWTPHLILCDAAWAGMEPALLARLRQSARSAETPVVFTAASVLE